MAVYEAVGADHVSIDLQAMWKTNPQDAQFLLTKLQQSIASHDPHFEYARDTTTLQTKSHYAARVARQHGGPAADQALAELNRTEGTNFTNEVTTVWFAPVIVVPRDSLHPDGRVNREKLLITQGVVTELNADGTPKQAYTTGQDGPFYAAAVERSFSILTDPSNKQREGGYQNDGQTYDWPIIAQNSKIPLWEGLPGQAPAWAHVLPIPHYEPTLGADGLVAHVAMQLGVKKPLAQMTREDFEGVRQGIRTSYDLLYDDRKLPGSAANDARMAESLAALEGLEIQYLGPKPVTPLDAVPANTTVVGASPIPTLPQIGLVNQL